jgi:general secretion pathway protein C
MLDLRRHRLVLECALLALVAYLGAFGVSAMLRSGIDEVPPADPEGGMAGGAPAVEPLAAYAVIAERDVFNPTPGGATGGVERTLRLEGVALHGTEARAVIEDTSTRRQELYRVGDAVGDARVTAIGWDRVTLIRRGREEVLELGPPDAHPEAAGADSGEVAVATAPAPADARIRRTGENAFVVDRRELAGATDNMSALVTQLRAVAEVRDGRPAGFRLFQIRDGSLFARLGLRDGDVVRRVNGSPVADPTALLGFLQDLESKPRVALDIIRGETPRTLVYDLR